MHVLVLHNAPTLPPDHPDAESEREVVDTAAIVATELRDAGFRVSQLGISSDPSALLESLKQDRPDVVFNLFEGTAGRPQAEAYVLGLLEWLGVPFTGCPMQSAVLARDKPRAKLLLQGAGLPTPRFLLVDAKAVPANPLGWPVIVKPAYEDASVGVDQESVCTNQDQLQRRVELLVKRFGPPVLVEEFISGREFNVAVIDAPTLRVLPVAEIVFRGQEQGLWPIVTYEAKWHSSSAEDLATQPRCPAEVEPRLAERLSGLALDAFRLFACRGYARVDLRANASGAPFILEVNPNPCYHPTAGLTKALHAAGITHAEFSVALVRQALS